MYTFCWLSNKVLRVFPAPGGCYTRYIAPTCCSTRQLLYEIRCTYMLQHPAVAMRDTLHLHVTRRLLCEIRCTYMLQHPAVAMRDTLHLHVTRRLLCEIRCTYMLQHPAVAMRDTLHLHVAAPGGCYARYVAPTCHPAVAMRDTLHLHVATVTWVDHWKGVPDAAQQEPGRHFTSHTYTTHTNPLNPAPHLQLRCPRV